jgi:aminoglycoside phosphotransferase (APT) family kinase protein
MSTIGHPLSDLINMTTPYHISGEPDHKGAEAFKEGATPGLPTEKQLVQWYAEVAGWDPTPDITWGVAFHFFRSTCIYQGIAARYAVRQASSALAKANGELRHVWARIAWRRVQSARALAKDKAKL